MLDPKPIPEEGGLGRAFLAGDGLARAADFVGETSAGFCSALGAGSLEADGLAIEENFGMPDDLKGVAEFELSIMARCTQGVYGEPGRGNHLG